MSARRHWLSIITLAALLFTPFAAMPPAAAQTTTVTFQIDRLDDVVSGAAGSRCTATPNDCSLRDAINRANSYTPATARKVISFQQYITAQVNGGDQGPYTFTIANSEGDLPSITADNVEIVAPLNISALPRIQIDGNNRNVGLQMRGSNGLIRGLSLYGFSISAPPFLGSAIYIAGREGNPPQAANRNQVEGSFIGIAANGATPAGRANAIGIHVGNGATNTIIGSATTGSTNPNYIAGNQNQGVYIQGATNTVIQNNRIGLARVGEAIVPAPNLHGIQIFSEFGTTSSGTIIGGNDASLANVIGANTAAGIYLRGSGVISTTILSNYIGVSDIGTDLFGNVGHGVLIESGARDTMLEGFENAPLVISGNGDPESAAPAYGILVRAGSGTAPSNTTIRGATYIGTRNTGTEARENKSGGVLIDTGVSNTVIEGDGVNLRISGNTGYGVHVRGATGTRISGALIGVTPPSSGSPTATNQVANIEGGVFVENATDTQISSNVVSGNGNFGLSLSNAVSTTIQSNVIGLNRARDGARGNSGPGIRIVDSQNTLVGGPTGRNYIAANGVPDADPQAGHGVQISGTATLSVTVQGNTIGLRCANADDGLAVVPPCTSPAAYIVPIGNRGDGVHVNGGGDVRVHENLIADSGAAAIRVAGVPATPIPVSGSDPLTVSLRLNQIGYLETATPNTFANVASPEGIVISDARAFEVISNSVRFTGVGPNLHLTNALSSTIAGNLLSNGAAEGVLVAGASRGLTLRANTMRANAAAAVQIAPSAQRITLDVNRMAANGAGIVLEGTSLYAGTGADPAQTAPGANRDIDPPFDLRADQSGRISGKVHVATTPAGPTNNNTPTPISACAAPCSIQAFAGDPTLPAFDGQGWTPMTFNEGFNSILADENGAFNGVIDTAIPAHFVLTATDAFGNTSAFSVAFTRTYGLRLTPIDPVSLAISAAPTEQVVYRLLLENTGSVDFTNLNYVTSETLENWNAVFDPVPFPLLNSGATRELTVTVTLPNGIEANAEPGTIDRTRVTVNSPGTETVTTNLVLNTTVIAQPVLRVDPLQNPLGLGVPGSRVSYEHQITNDGNASVVVQLDWITNDPALSDDTWATTVSTDTFRLAPGQTQSVTVNVTVPNTAQVVDIDNNPVRATTYLTATAEGFPAATVTFSDTTGVALSRRAQFFSDESQNARAGATVTFFHELINESNGEASFRLNVSTNFNSEVTLASNTAGIEIVGNIVTLPAPVGENPSRMQLRVTVRLSDRRLPGDSEVITIFLSDPITGTRLDANVVNTIIVTEAFLLPRLYLPLIRSAVVPSVLAPQAQTGALSSRAGITAL